MISSPRTDFSTNACAPASRAAETASSSPNAASTTDRASGTCVLAAAITSRPVPSGSCRSTSSSSGRTRAIRRVASATVAASATTVRSSWLSSTSAMPRRTISWSSTIITRTGCRTSLTLSGRRHAGAAYLQLHVQHDLRRLAAVLGCVDEQSGSPLSDLDRGYGDRGQRWGEQPGHRYLVEPHHGHRLRHCYPAFGEP